MKGSTTFIAPMIYLKKKPRYWILCKSIWRNWVAPPGREGCNRGGTEIDPVKDYDGDYRQGCVADPFGHHGLIEKKIGN